MAKDNNYSFESVPHSEKKGVFTLTMIMLGLTFFSASIWAGNALFSSMTNVNFFLSVLIGNILLGFYAACLSYIGSYTGLSTYMLARHSFGSKGFWLPSVIIGLIQIGWFGIGIAIFAVLIHKATDIDLNTLLFISGLVMTSTVYFGLYSIMLLAAIAVPSIAILGCYSVVDTVEHFGNSLTLNAELSNKNIDLSVAIAMVIGSFIGAGTVTSDFARYSKTPRSAVTITFLAFFIGNSLMFFFGAFGDVNGGLNNISEKVVSQGIFIPATTILILSIWTTNNHALYSSGLAFSTITGIKSKPISVINGLVGTLLSLWLYENFLDWITIVSYILPSIGGIIISDFLIKRKKYYNLHKRQYQPINWPSIIALFIGVISGLILPGIVPINTLIISIVSYLICDYISNKELYLSKSPKLT